jgi:thymidylate synthase (FAD)
MRQLQLFAPEMLGSSIRDTAEITVQVIHYSPLETVVRAGLKCVGLESKFEEYTKHPKTIESYIADKIKLGHLSLLGHINYTFEISGVSRALLQQWSRHSFVANSVQSTRWALKRILDGNWPQPALPATPSDEILKGKVIEAYYASLSTIREMLGKGYKNDEVKALIPECFPTSFLATMNAWEFHHIVKLRSGGTVMEEFRTLVWKMVEALPESHRFMFKGQ